MCYLVLANSCKELLFEGDYRSSASDNMGNQYNAGDEKDNAIGCQQHNRHSGRLTPDTGKRVSVHDVFHLDSDQNKNSSIIMCN